MKQNSKKYFIDPKESGKRRKYMNKDQKKRNSKMINLEVSISVITPKNGLNTNSKTKILRSDKRTRYKYKMFTQHIL